MMKTALSRSVNKSYKNISEITSRIMSVLPRASITSPGRIHQNLTKSFGVISENMEVCPVFYKNTTLRLVFGSPPKPDHNFNYVILSSQYGPTYLAVSSNQ